MHNARNICSLQHEFRGLGHATVLELARVRLEKELTISQRARSFRETTLSMGNWKRDAADDQDSSGDGPPRAETETRDIPPERKHCNATRFALYRSATAL